MPTLYRSSKQTRSVAQDGKRKIGSNSDIASKYPAAQTHSQGNPMKHDESCATTHYNSYILMFSK